jgi:aspartyl-tRNA(Asn)/glutamyl-tRNA(Gln) amidotransferase subunit C
LASNAILAHVAELNELNTTAVEPMAQVSELLHGTTEPLRVDERRPSLDRALVMAGAPATDGTFFKVPKVIER